MMKRMNKRIYFATLLALLSMSVNGYAADVTMNNNEEEVDINVTANRTALMDLDTPSAMNVITPEDLKNSGAKNAFDAVATVPGVTINSYSASGGDFGGMDSRTNIRGLDRGALILLNGVPMNLNGKGGLGSIPTSAIKRIEVVKGAASTLYGAEALGGVINVITKTPDKEGGSATVAIGNRGSKRYDVSYGTDKFIVGIDRKYWGSQNPSSPVRYDYAGTKHYDYYSAINKGNALGVFMSGKVSDKVTLNFNRSENRSSYGLLSTETNPVNQARHSTSYNYKDDRNNASLIYKDKGTTGTVFYNDRTMRGESRVHNTNQFKPTDTSYNARQYGVDVQHEWDFRGGKDYLVAGFTGKQDTYHATQTPVYIHPHRNTYAIYGSYSYEINPKWTSILGLRYTAIQDPVKDQRVLTPQFQLLHTINKQSSMYMNVGKAFTMPSLSDTFRSVARQYTAVSGKNLKPEEGWNYEVGYKQINKKDSWKVDAFYMDFKNFFQWERDASGRPTVRVNGGQFRNVGIEAEYSRRLSKRLNVKLGGSYSNPRQKEMNQNYWKQVAPKLQFTTGIYYASPTWEAGTSFNFVTKRLRNRDGGLNPNIALWNAYVGYHFNKVATLRLDARNLLNRHNVITNGDYEYWDEPFNYELSYTHKF